MPHIRKVNELATPYLDLPLDTHNMTKVISHLLARENISHRVYFGEVKMKDEQESVSHAWIRLGTGEIVDFRSRRCFPGRDDVPYGVFSSESSPICYEGIDVDLSVSKTLFDALTRGP